MANEPLRQQMGARERLTAKKYDWKHVAQRVFDYYVKVLNESPRKG